MNDDREALFRAVLDAPDDDALRLVYADWLDEHGEPERAEFIRVQTELAGCCDCLGNGQCDPTLCRKCWLRIRELALWKDHGAAWSRPLVETAGIALNDDEPGAPTGTWTNVSIYDDNTGGHAYPPGLHKLPPVRDGVLIYLGWQFRRGIPHVVRVGFDRLDNAVGGRCHCWRPNPDLGPRTDNAGTDSVNAGQDLFREGCPACVAGRTPGVLVALSRVAPIEGVRAADIQPDKHGALAPRRSWIRADDDAAVNAWIGFLPGRLFDRLPIFPGERPSPPKRKTYPDGEAALDALSVVLVMLAREHLSVGAAP